MPKRDIGRSEPELEIGVRIRDAAEPVLHAVVGQDPNHDEVVHDLLNSTVEKVLRRIHKVGEPEDLEQYSKEAARNAFRDWLRWKKRHPLDNRKPKRHDGESAPDWVTEVAASSLTPSSEIVRREDQARHAGVIAQAWEQLAPMERCVLELRFRERRSREEVAELLGYKNVAVVDATVARARKKLLTELPSSLIGRVGLG